MKSTSASENVVPTNESRPAEAMTAEPTRKKTKITLRPVGEVDAQTEETQTPSFEVQYGGNKGIDEFRKNPLVPVGAGATALILIGGLMAFRAGNSRLSQRMMQARVIAQGTTLGILSYSVANMRSAQKDQQNASQLDTEASSAANASSDAPIAAATSAENPAESAAETPAETKAPYSLDWLSTYTANAASFFLERLR